MSLEQAHALDPQPYLLLVMSDFEMLSPESVKTFFYVIFFFFSPPSYFTCAEQKICSSSLEKTKGPVF